MVKLKGYILCYTEDCTPRYRLFKSKTKLKLFVADLVLRLGTNNQDFWIDAIVNGSMMVTEEGVRIEYDDEDANLSSESEDGDEPRQSLSKDSERSDASNLA